ncbi:hypothetical protein ACP9OK_10570 [Pseudomonas sp. B11]
MPLTKPNQELRRDLKEVAALLKWSGVNLMQIATRLSEAGHEQEARGLIEAAINYQEAEDKLEGYAEEVKEGRIARGKVE